MTARNESERIRTRAFVSLLEKSRSDDERRSILESHRDLCTEELVQTLSEHVVRLVRDDGAAALALAQTSLLLAHELDGRANLATSLRSLGNAWYGLGDYRVALGHYEEAVALFEERGSRLETARTLSASLQSRILLGDYDSAFSAAGRAREIFRELGERKREARLDINVGNILHRQDRFLEALELYENAYRTLVEFRDPEGVEGVAAALSNISGCMIMLNDFPRGLQFYQEARRVCADHGMPKLVARADYNIAYLYYLRGEYSRSIEMLNEARQSFRKGRDGYHGALCDMDQAEIYLDLNLYAESARLASRARRRFARLGTGYERAKSMAIEAIALSNQGKAMRALTLFARARERFLEEKNQVWPWTIDLYRALVYGDEGRLFEAHRLARSTMTYFEKSGLASKAILCRLLLARLALRIGDVASAKTECERALREALAADSPFHAFQASFLRAQVEEASGDTGEAFASYEDAATILESLRSSLQRDELKIAFMRNRHGVYEALVELCLLDDAPSAHERALDYIERSKARALIDLILGSIRGRSGLASGESELARRVHQLREELDWYYRRIEHEQLSRDVFNPERVGELSRSARDREKELLDALRELPEGEGRFGGLKESEPVPLSRIQRALGAERALVEYYVARGRVYAGVVTEDGVTMVALAVSDHVRSLVQRLQFQISKFQLPADYVEIFEESIHETTLVHLQELHECLVGPISSLVQGRDLVIVPHSFMHYLPFHALYDGDRYLIDDYAVSYAPSATVYVHCVEQPRVTGERALVLGVTDPSVPFIQEEVQSVADSVPRAEVRLDSAASVASLRDNIDDTSLIHIATHGYFRRDNPMFSGIRLGDSYLSLYDLYELTLPVELVTVSACATGMSVVVDGDEILGLVRGLLYAGARSLVVALWNVHDQATASLMRSFYGHLSDSSDRAAALRCAMLEQREKTPQPYYWAPYVLVGRVGSP